MGVVRVHDYKAVVGKVGTALTVAVSEDQVAQGLVDILVGELAIDRAALWLYSTKSGASFRFARAHGIDREMPRELEIVDVISESCSKHDRVVIYCQGKVVGDVTWQCAVYLVCQGITEGILLLGSDVEDGYDEDSIWAMGLAAEWAASTLSLLRVYRERLRLQQQVAAVLISKEEDAKRRIAADIHDRGITSLGLLKQTFMQRWTKKQLADGIQKVIDDLREISGSELAPFLGGRSLVDALEHYVLERSPGRNIRIVFGVSESEKEKWSALDGSVCYNLYFAVREAAENAIKVLTQRAEGGTIQISLSVAGDGRVVVKDDGPGFDTTGFEQVRRGTAGFGDRAFRGLSLMHARMVSVGGTMSVTSEKDRGTTVEFLVPMSST